MTTTTGEARERLAGLATAETIKRPQIKSFQLDESGVAYAEIVTGHVRGKLVVVPGQSA
jgi:hypothetical protein